MATTTGEVLEQKTKSKKDEEDDPEAIDESEVQDEGIPDPEPAVPSVGPPLPKSESRVEEAERGTKPALGPPCASFLYRPFAELPNLSQYDKKIIEIRVPSEYMCKTNKAYRTRRFWGSDIYTANSDIVCILQHSSKFEIKDYPPTQSPGVAVFCRVMKAKNSYQSSSRNHITSRKLGQYDVAVLLIPLGLQSQVGGLPVFGRPRVPRRACGNGQGDADAPTRSRRKAGALQQRPDPLSPGN